MYAPVGEMSLAELEKINEENDRIIALAEKAKVLNTASLVLSTASLRMTAGSATVGSVGAAGVSMDADVAEQLLHMHRQIMAPQPRSEATGEPADADQNDGRATPPGWTSQDRAKELTAAVAAARRRAQKNESQIRRRAERIPLNRDLDHAHRLCSPRFGGSPEEWAANSAERARKRRESDKLRKRHVRAEQREAVLQAGDAVAKAQVRRYKDNWLEVRRDRRKRERERKIEEDRAGAQELGVSEATFRQARANLSAVSSRSFFPPFRPGGLPEVSHSSDFFAHVTRPCSLHVTGSSLSRHARGSSASVGSRASVSAGSISRSLLPLALRRRMLPHRRLPHRRLRRRQRA